MKRNNVNVRNMVLCAMFACLAFVLNTFVYFPAMAPFQHFVDVLAVVSVNFAADDPGTATAGLLKISKEAFYGSEIRNL